MTENNQKTYKVFCVTMPASGHCIPLYPILNELIEKHKNVEVTVYTAESRRKDFENVGAKYKNLIYDESIHSKGISETNTVQVSIFERFTRIVRVARNNCYQIARDIDREKPDLIIYDYTLPARFFNLIMLYYRKRYEEGQKMGNQNTNISRFIPTYPLPPMIGFSPAFIFEPGLFPNKEEFAIMMKRMKFSFSVFWQLIIYFFTLFKFCFEFGLGYINPFSLRTMGSTPETKLVMSSIFRDLQPRAHLYDSKRFKFIGSTVNESINNNIVYSAIKDEKIKKLLETVNKDQDEKLIYVSLGTVFNTKINIFKTIFDAFKTFDQEPEESKSNIKLNDLKVIVSTGDKIYNRFEELKRTNEYSIPDNIVLVKTAPQTEILKKSALFVTHSGMNSTSESINYAGKLILANFKLDYKLFIYFYQCQWLVSQ